MVSNENLLDDLIYLDINGTKQCILVRSYNFDNPIILYIHGGPGMSNFFLYPYESKLEKNFTIIKWDQRGCCKSYNHNIDKSTLTLNQLILDAEKIVEYIYTTFNKKIHLIAHSWGTLIAINLINRNPNLFLGYISIGQIVNIIKSEEISRLYVLYKAIKNNDFSSVRKIKNLSHKSVKSSNKLDSLVKKYGGSLVLKNKLQITMLKLIIRCKYYTIKDYYKYIKGIYISQNMLKDAFEINLFEDISEVKVPIYFINGKNDYITPNEVLKQYYNKLNAPKKDFILLNNSAHSPNIEEPEVFNKLVIKYFLQTRK